MCHPSWDDYLDLNETVTKMAHRLMEEDGQEVQTPSKMGTTPKQKEVAQVAVLPPNDNTLHEVIIETEKALCDVSHIDAHYVSHVVTVMTAWQEVVQATASHMENADTAIYLAQWEDARRVTKEYMATVIKAREECDAAHTMEQEAWKEAIEADDFEDPVVYLLHITHKAAHAQAEKAVDAFLASIKTTLQKHVPVNAQGPLIANALSMAFQFQMSVWHMIGEECIQPLRVNHLDWCGLAGIVQAIVKTFPKNCALMFPPPPVPITSFTSTFRPESSDDEDDENTFGASSSFCRFESSLPAPSSSVRGGISGAGLLPCLHVNPSASRGCLYPGIQPEGEPSSTLGMSPDDDDEGGPQPGDEEVDMGLEADDEGNGEKDAPGDDSLIDPGELELLKGIINPVVDDEPPTAPKSGDKQGLTHLNGGSGSSDSSGEDLDAKGIQVKKKMAMPTKVLHPSQWSPEDIDVMRQIRYKTDFDCFQTYRRNKIKPADIASINTKDHNAYIKVVKADPSSVVQKSIFSVAAYCEVLWLKGGDTSKFDKEVGTKFKKSAKTSRAPNTVRVDIDWVMLVCQHENGVNVAYFDPDGFGRPGTMGLWDLHSSDTLSQAKM